MSDIQIRIEGRARLPAGAMRLLTSGGALLYACVVYSSFSVAPAAAIFGASGRLSSGPQFGIQILLAVLPSFCLPMNIRRFSGYQLWILYLTVIVPSCMLSPVISQRAFGFWVEFLIIMDLCFVLLCQVRRLPLLGIPFPRLSPMLSVGLIAALSAVTYLGLFHYYGLSGLLLPLSDVYDVRVRLRDTPIPSLLVYCYFWQGLVVNPVIQAYGVLRRRYVLLGFGVLLQVVLYSLTSLRVFLMADFFQLGLVVFYTLVRRNRGTFLVYGMMASLIVMTGWNIVQPRSYTPLIFMDRWVFCSGQLSAYYCDFFTSHPYTHLQDVVVSVLRRMFPGPHDLPAGELIGREYFPPLANGSYTNAAAHVWADSFGIWGYPAMFVATVFAAVLIWIIDSSLRGIDERFALLCSCMVGLSLSAQGAQTAVLTGGAGALVLVVLSLRGSFRAALGNGPAVPV